MSLLREYIRELFEANEYGWEKANRKTMGQDGKAKGRRKKNWLGQNTDDEIVNWYKKMGLAESHFPIYAQDKMRIHHSRSGSRIDDEPQVSGFSQEPGYKPEGLWYECQDGSSESWEQFCAWNLTDGANRYDSSYNVVLKDDGYYILHITDEQHLEKFNKMYSINHPADLDGTKGLDKVIDWPRVASDYAGIEICPYLSSKRNDDDFFWYYGWDVASGCIWDSSGIKELIKSGDCNEPTP